MQDEKVHNEIIYQMTMAAVRELLDEGLITSNEYNEFDTKMQQKYSPKFGILFTNNNLL